MISPKPKNKIFLCILCLLMLPGTASAKCGGSFMNPISDVCWECIFPIKIAGISIGTGMTDGLPDPPDAASFPICVCPFPPPIFYRVGISISFWEPARLIETVKDPFCFPFLGMSIYDGMANTGELCGTNDEEGGNQESATTFSQVHYMIFPVWAMMELLTDLVCVESGGFDVAYMTEFDPLWNDDELMFALQPEALLFANPVAQFSCMADSASSNIGLPIPELFWCIGTHGSVYPLSGIINQSNYVQSQAALASRMIYKLAREFLLMDTGVNLCGAVPTPIWVKWHYRLQLAKPVKGSGCMPIGRTGLLWSAGKNPPFISGGDNFLFVNFRKKVCCAF